MSVSIMKTTFKTYNEFLNESLDPSSIFKKKQTGDSYLDILDFFRKNLGELDADNKEKKRKLFDKAKEVIVNVDNIIPNQDYLNKDQVTKYQKTKGELPLGVMIGKDVILFDGHHRVAAEILNGTKQIKMLVLKS